MVSHSANLFTRERDFRIVKHSAQTPMGVPVLRIRGDAYQITETPGIHQAGGILGYFKRFLQSQYMEDENAYKLYRYIIMFVLNISMRASGSFYDRPDFNFDLVFPTETRPYSFQDHRGDKEESDRSLLLDAVQAELDRSNFVKPVACFSNFSKDALLHEVDRIFKGQTAFFYQIEGKSIPSIAFAHVQPARSTMRIVASLRLWSALTSHNQEWTTQMRAISVLLDAVWIAAVGWTSSSRLRSSKPPRSMRHCAIASGLSPSHVHPSI
jgi:hypothetical protein